jgi:hypothetical protein
MKRRWQSSQERVEHVQNTGCKADILFIYGTGNYITAGEYLISDKSSVPSLMIPTEMERIPEQNL